MEAEVLIVCSCGLEWPAESCLEMGSGVAVSNSLRGLVVQTGPKEGLFLLPPKDCSCLLGDPEKHFLKAPTVSP